MAKIGIFGLDNFFSGSKVNLVDPHIDKLKDLFKSSKRVYLQVELIYEQEKLSEADGIIADKNKKLDLILIDLEFVETRLSRAEDDKEKALLSKFKDILEKESFLNQESLDEEERKIVSGFGLLTLRPIYLVDIKKDTDPGLVLSSAYKELGYISFFTAASNEARAWSLKKGMTARDAAGVIHSDIQRGFIRAEVVSYDDLISSGHLNSARSAGLLRLENKEYIVQDRDWMLFRFNK